MVNTLSTPILKAALRTDLYDQQYDESFVCHL